MRDLGLAKKRCNRPAPLEVAEAVMVSSLINKDFHF